MKNSISLWGDLVARDLKGLYLSNEVQNIIKASEKNIINFEAPIENNYHPIHKSGPNNTQAKEAPCWAMSMGFNLFSFANNHSMDFGIDALQDTISRFPKETIMGAGTWNEAYSPKEIVLENGKRIGIISGTHKEFGTLDDEICHTKAFGTAWLFHSKITNAIIRIRCEVDYLYIYAHGGLEFVEQPLPEWRAAFRHFIDIGCDGVICSHPHIPMGWETYKGKPIFYSLGNFCFQKPGVPKDKLKPHWNDSLCVTLKFDKSLPSWTIQPIQYNIDTKEISLNHGSDILEYLAKINNTLSDSDKYQQYIDNAVISMLPMYLSMLNVCKSNGILGGVKQVLSFIIKRKEIDLVHTLNAIQCESHRWAIERAIRLKYKIIL